MCVGGVVAGGSPPLRGRRHVAPPAGGRLSLTLSCWVLDGLHPYGGGGMPPPQQGGDLFDSGCVSRQWSPVRRQRRGRRGVLERRDSDWFICDDTLCIRKSARFWILVYFYILVFWSVPSVRLRFCYAWCTVPLYRVRTSRLTTLRCLSL
jgi:hypothetical protein